MQGRVYYAEWIALPAPGEPGLAFVQARPSYASPLAFGSTTRLTSLLTYLTYTMILLQNILVARARVATPSHDEI